MKKIILLLLILPCYCYSQNFEVPDVYWNEREGTMGINESTESNYKKDELYSTAFEWTRDVFTNFSDSTLATDRERGEIVAYGHFSSQYQYPTSAIIRPINYKTSFRISIFVQNGSYRLVIDKLKFIDEMVTQKLKFLKGDPTAIYQQLKNFAWNERHTANEKLKTKVFMEVIRSINSNLSEVITGLKSQMMKPTGKS